MAGRCGACDPAPAVRASEPVMRALAVWRAALDEERRLPEIERRREEREFLPAALEVLETPASPAGRTTAGLVCALFCLAVVWSWFGHIDTVAVAQGRIVPGGQVKLIQPLDVGVVRAIHVREGQRVRAGDALVDLDPTESEVDLDQTRRVLEEAKMEHARAEYGMRSLEAEAAVLDRPEGVGDAIFEAQRERLESDLRLLEARLAALDSEADRLAAARAGEVAQIEALAPLIEIARDHERGLRALFEKKLGARSPWLDARRELAGREREVTGHRHRIRQLDSEIAAVARRRDEIVAEFLRHAAASRVEALATMEQARLELRSASLRAERNRLRAPVNGTVHRLSVHTVGGVVRAAEPLMAIVPEGVALEVEVSVLNRDIGFIEVGQPVEVKVEAFPFTRYGLVEGEVAHLSADSVVDDALGPVYPMKVRLGEERIRVGNRWVGLSPGMSVAAEVKTGKRRAIEFFLAPLLRYRSEALRER